MFYKTEIHSRQKDGWKKPFIADNLKGIKAVYDLVDAKNNKVIIETGKKSPKERLIKMIKLKIYLSQMKKY